MSNYEFWDELGRIFNAVVAYQEKSIEFNKRFINPWIRLGNVFDKQDRHREAVNAYQKAVEIDPDSAQNWCDLGNAYFRTEAYDQAIHAFQKAIELDPCFGWSYSNLALIYVTQGDHEQAVSLYKKSIELLQDNKDRAVSWNRLGNLYRKLNEYDLAVQAFQKADELDHENAGFRDELDDASAGASPTAVDTPEGADSSQGLIANPIQLIVEESQAEEAALIARAGELMPASESEEDLSGEAGEDLPAAVSGELPEAAADVQVTADATGQVGPLDPIQRREELGRLPEELTVDLGGETPITASEAVDEAVTEEAAGDGPAGIGEAQAESMVESSGPAYIEVAGPGAAAETDSPITVQTIVETFTESLIATNTTTETSDIVLSIDENKVEDASVIEEAVAAVEPLPGPSAPQDVAQESTPEVSVEAVETLSSEPLEASEVAKVQASEQVETAEAAPVTMIDLVEAEEPPQIAISQPVETAEAAPTTIAESVGTAEAAQEVAPEPVAEPNEVVDELPAKALEVLETVQEPTRQLEDAVAVPQPAVELEADQPAVVVEEELADSDVPTEETVKAAEGDVQGATEAPSATEPEVREAEQAAPREEDQDHEAEALQHAAYEEFLKDDGGVLNTMTVTPVEETTIIEDAPVPAEPATKINASGEFHIAMDTKNAHVWNELGNVYFNNGAIEDSIVAYSKAIELDRWFAWPYSNLALAYVQKARFAEAVLLYQRSIELFQSEKDKAVSWNRLGNVYRRMNDYENAIAAYQRADELDPDNTTLSLQSRFSLLGSYQVEQSASYTA